MASPRTAGAGSSTIAGFDAAGLQPILAGVSVGVVVQSFAGEIVYGNAAAERILGLSLDQMRGRTSIDPRWRAIREDGRPYPGEEHPAMVTLQTGLAVQNAVMGVHKTDGTLTWIAIDTQLVRLEGGERQGVVSTFRDVTETMIARAAQERSQAEIEHSERRYRLLADHVHDVIWKLDLASLKYSYVSPSITALRGLSVEEALAEPIERSLTPESLARVQAVMARVGTPAEEDPHTGIYDQPCRDGTVKHVEITTTLLRDAAGRPVGAVGVSRDATARVEAERALIDTATQLRAMFEQAAVGVVHVDAATGRFLEANARFCGMLGYPREAVMARSWTDFTHPDDLAENLAGVRKMLESGVPYRTEKRFLRSDGSILWASISVTRIARPGEAPTSQVAIVEDITDRKTAEEALRRSEERFRALIENSTDLIVTVDAQGIHRFWSQGAARILGWAPEEVVGHQTLDIIHPDDRSQVARALAQVVERPGNTVSVQVRCLHRDGSWRLLETTARNLLGHSAVGAVVVNGRDVTAHRQLEEQLQQSQKLESVGRLAGGVAHDFNNLLTVILSCCSSLDEALADGGPVSRDDVREIDAAARRATELTGQLLAFARKQVLNPVLVDLGEVVARSERMLARLLGEDVTLLVERQPDLWTISADPGQLTQVIVNLAVNARDAMPTGGRLLIQTANASVSAEAAGRESGAVAGEWVRLEVRDSGTGMDSETKAHLFEPFYTTKEQGKGTGLGLAMVYGIVKQAGGHIHVESEVGRGTTVQVCFPRHAGTVPAPVRAEEPRRRRGSERVLVVEDDPQVRSVMVQALRRAGYEVLAASHPQQALELSGEKAGQLKLVITDVVMPGLDGRLLARELRRRIPSLRVLFVSGYAPDTIAVRSAGTLEGTVLPKPFTAAILLDRVRAVLDEHS